MRTDETATRHRKRKGVAKNSKTKVDGDDLHKDLDALFKLPLAEFTGARNTLAAGLKKSGRGDDAARVKGLAKPPISAWAVNQLYWNHRASFDRLIASGERFHAAQSSGKVAEMRTALGARREALMLLSDLATSLLQEADHNPSLDIIRRVTSTLEAMSAYASRSDAPRAGRLTHDVDPPGFESFGSFVPAPGLRKIPPPPPPVKQQQESARATQPRIATAQNARRLEEKRKANIAAAKVSLQRAKRALATARSKVQSLEGAQRKAEAEAEKAEKLKRDLERSLEKAKVALEAAARRARSIAAEAEEAATALDDAEGTFAAASNQLETLSRESS